MSDRVICKLCGHDHDEHRYGDPPRCARCPGGVCQNGPDGEKFRDQPT